MIEIFCNLPVCNLLTTSVHPEEVEQLKIGKTGSALPVLSISKAG